jgi:F0F1-type ATP synthase delta subunit
MEGKSQAPQKKFALPPLITGPGDVGRTLLELEQLEDFLRAAGLRKGGDGIRLPKMSRTLERLAELNDANLLQAAERQRLVAFLKSLQQHAPVLHISFASEPSAAFTAKIVEWLRANISQFVLVQIGLQPSIAAGCVVRTTNKSFDFSLRKNLAKNRNLLINALKSTSQDVVPSADSKVAP